MNRVRVVSTMIASVGYDAAAKILEIEFTNTKIYRYFMVPERTYGELLNAPSAGEYFLAYIKSRFPFEEIARG